MIRTNQFHMTDYYRQSSEVYQEASREEEMNIKMLEEKVPEVLKVWKDRGHHSGSAQEPFSILSVGASVGVVDVPILTAVANYFSDLPSKKASIHNEVVDPNDYSLSKYKALAVSLSANLQHKADISCKFNVMTYQSYINQEGSTPGKFDMVHFLHSLYYFRPKEERASLLEHAYKDLLKERGVILVMVLTKDTLYEALRWHDFEKYGDSLKADDLIHSEDVIDMVQKHNWKFEVFRSDWLWDVTEMFNEDSEKGNKALDYIHHCRDFRATAGSERVASTLAVIKSHSFVDKDGRRKSKYGNKLIAIYKGFAH